MDASTNLAVLLGSPDLDYFDLDSGIYFDEKGLEVSPYCSFKVDSVYEKNRKRDNREIFRNIVKDYRVMKEHAKNGFRKLSKGEQIRLIIEMEDHNVNVLRNGSFYVGEIDYYDNKIRKKVKSIYEPFIKWKREKLKNDRGLSS